MLVPASSKGKRMLTRGAVLTGGFLCRFTINVATGYNYFVTFGNMTGSPSRFWLSFADTATTFIPGNNYPTPPGPPCSSIPTIYLPATSAASKARAVADGKSVSMFSIPSSHTNAVAAEIGPAVGVPGLVAADIGPSGSTEYPPVRPAMPHPRNVVPSLAPAPAPAVQRAVPREDDVQAGLIKFMASGTHGREEPEGPRLLAPRGTGTERLAHLQAPMQYAQGVFGPPLNITLNVNVTDIPDPFGNITTISSQYPSPPPSFLVQPLPVVG